MGDRLITSLTNDTVKAVRALHMRKEREATGRFLAEGLKFIGEALDQNRAPRLLLVGEDARKYAAREVRRGSKYDGIILDPPKYGRGPTGEVWRLFEDLPGLLKDCAALLSDDASFLLLNAYAARISGLSLAHLMAEATHDRGGVIDWGELALAEDGADGRAIGLSFFARWSA